MSELVLMLQPQKFTTVAQQPSRTLALTSDALRCSTSEARAKARAFVHLRGKMYIGYFGLNDKKCVWLGVSWGLDLAFLDAD